MSSLLTYKYYDTPEGQDILKKTIVTSKNACLASIPIATFDVLLYSHPQGFFNTAFRYGTYFGTAIGMASAFTLTANIAQNVRGKNDGLNYFMGGAASGVVFSALRKLPLLSLPMSIFLGCVAVVKKEAIDEGYTFFPDVKMGTKNAWSARNDWTIAKDIEELKTWTTGTN
ncbi:NADH dehydrogenase [ubiquinone] 1 alpha subcomplex subunit 11 [Zerene cesonia]|uniref:NADH dehydrogenase [ubiquinone] 1 alpha subcomplex subunit 11 n=1 Tax=Zerene cesonia TaxID=33412 RepID=UPI0018E5378A|nr:NADH dehydrogenase [ubiquinone] 1 alpha subcomplex subunit 11 [Zerene cesonia]